MSVIFCTWNPTTRSYGNQDLNTVLKVPVSSVPFSAYRKEDTEHVQSGSRAFLTKALKQLFEGMSASDWNAPKIEEHEDNEDNHQSMAQDVRATDSEMIWHAKVSQKKTSHLQDNIISYPVRFVGFDLVRGRIKRGRMTNNKRDKRDTDLLCVEYLNVLNFELKADLTTDPQKNAAFFFDDLEQYSLVVHAPGLEETCHTETKKAINAYDKYQKASDEEAAAADPKLVEQTCPKTDQERKTEKRKAILQSEQTDKSSSKYKEKESLLKEHGCELQKWSATQISSVMKSRDLAFYNSNSDAQKRSISQVQSNIRVQFRKGQKHFEHPSDVVLVQGFHRNSTKVAYKSVYFWKASENYQLPCDVLRDVINDNKGVRCVFDSNKELRWRISEADVKLRIENTRFPGLLNLQVQHWYVVELREANPELIEDFFWETRSELDPNTKLCWSLASACDFRRPQPDVTRASFEKKIFPELRRRFSKTDKLQSPSSSWGTPGTEDGSKEVGLFIRLGENISDSLERWLNGNIWKYMREDDGMVNYGIALSWMWMFAKKKQAYGGDLQKISKSLHQILQKCEHEDTARLCLGAVAILAGRNEFNGLDRNEVLVMFQKSLEFGLHLDIFAKRTAHQPRPPWYEEMPEMRHGVTSTLAKKLHDLIEEDREEIHEAKDYSKPWLWFQPSSTSHGDPKSDKLAVSQLAPGYK
jgi:hypothetical protein